MLFLFVVASGKLVVRSSAGAPEPCVEGAGADPWKEGLSSHARAYLAAADGIDATPLFAAYGDIGALGKVMVAVAVQAESAVSVYGGYVGTGCEGWCQYQGWKAGFWRTKPFYASTLEDGATVPPRGLQVPVDPAVPLEPFQAMLVGHAPILGALHYDGLGVHGLLTTGSDGKLMLAGASSEGLCVVERVWVCAAAGMTHSPAQPLSATVFGRTLDDKPCSPVVATTRELLERVPFVDAVGLADRLVEAVAPELLPRIVKDLVEADPTLAETLAHLPMENEVAAPRVDYSSPGNAAAAALLALLLNA